MGGRYIGTLLSSEFSFKSKTVLKEKGYLKKTKKIVNFKNYE